MDCVKCGGGMKAADLRTGMHQTTMMVSVKKKSIADSTKMSTVRCYVCPRCGYIELQAMKPELFGSV